MPELPEVEVVRRGLAAHVLGRPVERVEVAHPRPLRRHLPGPQDFAARLTGRAFTDVRRRGKFLWLPLDGADPGGAMLAHLGMSGQMLLARPGAADERHLRVRIVLGGPGDAEPLELRYVDQRMFGCLWLSAAASGADDVPSEIAHIARDPLDEEFDDDGFCRRVRRSTSAVKRQLLDQRVVSGVGNIYADEALWRARVHGARPGNRLTRAQAHEVLDQVRAVMRDALAEGGTSFDALYVNVNGESGYFERSLRAYGREDLPCPRCGTPIRRVAFTNRSSYFCPRCQPVPRPRRAAIR
ncbi:MAG: bifunctional DNA-formamidopyrimidine glycosylase/DNA-(apurinic or apyrimidinic site) lyase [Marmoricola sp.]